MKRRAARSIIVLVTVLGFALVFAIAYTRGDPRFGKPLQILLITLTVFMAGYAIARRDLAGSVMAAGMAAWSLDTFYPQGALSYGGTTLFLAGVFLMTRKARAESKGAST